jgi:hypothetical protein
VTGKYQCRKCLPSMSGPLFDFQLCKKKEEEEEEEENGEEEEEK